MRIFILTGSLKGTAALHLPALLASSSVEVAMVIYNEGQILNKKRYYLRKLKKIWSIGLWGTWNGLRMRKWFKEDLYQLAPVESLEEQCRKANIPFRRVGMLNSPDTIIAIEESKADIGISLGNSYIAPSVFRKPRLGMINIHHEMLPAYQNAQSIIWQIYNGSAETGFTIHQIEKKIDAGAIVYQETMPIVFKDSLHATVTHTLLRLMELSSKGLVLVLENIEAYLQKAHKQGDGNSYTTPNWRQYLRIKANYKRLRQQHRQQ